MMRQDFQAQGATPSAALERLAGAGAGGEHSSNIERDVLRQLSGKTRPRDIHVQCFWFSIKPFSANIDCFSGYGILLVLRFPCGR